jgi:arylformamidase
MLPLDVLIGPTEVIQISEDVDVITADILEKASVPAKTVRLLIKTRNSRQWEGNVSEFAKNFVGISVDGAEWLVRRGVKLIGVDYLSVAPYKQSIPTHQILLKPGIIILEGVNLNAVPPGHYMLYCLPLKLVGSDGAPARAILIG